jgi:hypothetical protein
MNFHFNRLFRVAAWLLVVGGIWYLYLGARGALDGSRPWMPLVVVGVAALAVGTSLLRWFLRARD